jgi:endonuclease-3 related protein
MPSLGADYPSVVQALAAHYGQRKPAETALAPLARVLAAGITGGGEQAGAEKYLEALDRAGLLQAEALAAIEPTELIDTLRDQGVTLPARAAVLLKRLAGWFAGRFPDDVDAGDEAAWPTPRLRQELTAIRGIGQAKADAILLFGLGRPAYPLDRGTYRVLVRHGWIDPWADYDEVSQLLIHATGERTGELVRLSDWMTSVAKDFCKQGSPRCQSCPLKPFLLEQGPLQPD